MLIKKASLEFDEVLVPLTKIERIILHHSGEEGLELWGIHQLHKERYGWSGIGYNYFIEKNGDIYEGRGLNVGAHAKGHNSKSIGICLAGNFDLSPPNTAQLESSAILVSNLIDHTDLQLKSVYGHRELDSDKSCPGLFFDLEVFKDRVRRLEN